jgi:cytochrome c-type biogenesis protein CcmE
VALTESTPSGGPDEAVIADGGPVPRPPASRRRAVLGSRRRQLFAALVIGGALAWILFEGLNNATEYFKTADQAVADRASLGTRQFRIEGTVGPGVTELRGVTRFTIIANNVTVPVVDTREPSELFKPGIPVVLEGHWAGSVFDSDLVMVKHTAAYAAAHPDRLKSQLPAAPATLLPAQPGSESP